MPHVSFHQRLFSSVMFKLKSATEKKQTNKQCVCFFVLYSSVKFSLLEITGISAGRIPPFSLRLSQMIMFGGDVDLEREGSGRQRGQNRWNKNNTKPTAFTLHTNKKKKERRLFLFLYTVFVCIMFSCCAFTVVGRRLRQ